MGSNFFRKEQFMSLYSASIDAAEVEKFTKMAEDWWDVNGPFKPLHKFNPVRIGYIQESIKSHFSVSDIKNIRILDIGCGGGLLAEPLARLGAEVTAIDASAKNISIASIHAEKMGVKVDYQHTSVEDLAATGVQYDVVLTMEVVEHVADVESFMHAAATLVKPGGLLFAATLNRTLKSFAFAIVGAEYVLRWLPRGTHEWSKFLRPSELESYIGSQGLVLQDLKGVTMNPLTGEWRLSGDVSINYMIRAVKV